LADAFTDFAPSIIRKFDLRQRAGREFDGLSNQ